MTYSRNSNIGHQPNFTDCMAPDSVQGAGLKGVDQMAMQARQRLRRQDHDIDRADSPYGIDWESRERDYRAIDHMEKRKLRGGQTFGKHDTMGC